MLSASDNGLQPSKQEYIWFVIVHQARAIQSVQLFGTQDPYALGTLLPAGTEPSRTHTALSGGSEPCWDGASPLLEGGAKKQQAMLFAVDSANANTEQNILGRAVRVEVRHTAYVSTCFLHYRSFFCSVSVLISISV